MLHIAMILDKVVEYHAVLATGRDRGHAGGKFYSMLRSIGDDSATGGESNLAQRALAKELAVTKIGLNAACGILRAVAVAALTVAIPAGAALAQTSQTTVTGERYIPTIWVDPDGCEHWVMDDGAEGYMTPHVNRQGIPVCRRGNLCGVLNTDQLFATDSARINGSGRSRLAKFFRQADATSYIITGHTDSRASDQYNMGLSLRRANSVARIAQSVGARIADVRGYGERMPKATNATAAGMAQNRRVEIICIR